MDEQTLLLVNKVQNRIGDMCSKIETYKDSFEALRAVGELDKDKVFRVDLLSKFCQLTYIDPDYFDMDKGKLVMKLNLPELSIEKIALILDAVETVMNSEEYKKAV